MIPRKYLLGGVVMVKGREVRINPSDINRYFRTDVPKEEPKNMFKGLMKNIIFTKMNVDWQAPWLHVKKQCYFGTLAYEVAHLLYYLQQGQTLDICVLIKMEIHKCGKDESKKEAMGFPNLITHFCIQADIDLFTDEMKEPPGDIGTNQCYSLYPNRGLKRPREHKRTRAEDAGSKSEAGHDEGAEEDMNVRLLTQMLTILKATRSEQADAYAARKKEIKAVKEEILREIAASEGRTRVVISEVSQYSRQKKANLIPPAYTGPIGEPVISEEMAQMHIVMERSLKEMADREAAGSDPSGKGKGKLSGTS
ncbi:hypothetical protein LWI28_023192 [Acer negundo]|uniref:Putative plant transposon protein domain-containing protein n=1 Tax=Acer negundo TaxID=4023 RepID=A0AAD5JF16_ACENE|nr:hypothetical protein LWI28_023192 [Acer negundo]